MALTIEIGEGLPNAESYISAAAFAAYAAAYWPAAPADDASVVESALRRATLYIDGRYAARWPGRRVKGRAQALAWPRAGVIDRGGHHVPLYAVPGEVVRATAEAALRELAKPGSLTPDTVPGKTVRRITAGPVEVEYGEGGSLRPVVTIIEEILAPLLTPVSAYSGTLVRA